MVTLNYTTTVDVARTIAGTRALGELDADGPIERRTSNALASLASDLSKHPDTVRHQAIELGALLAYRGHLSIEAQVREWIEGVQ